MDATWDYWTSPSRTRSFAVVCPYGLQGVANPATGAAVGYLYDMTNTCGGQTSLSQHNNTFLATGYVDLGTYAGFTPYVGAGGGLNMSFTQGSSSFAETANGIGYAANLTNVAGFPSVWVNSAGQPISPQPNIPFTAQNWNRTINSTTYRFAWTLAAGVRLPSQPERNARRRLPLYQRRPIQSARQSADRADSEAAQRFPAGPRRRPLRPAIAERVRQLDAAGGFRRPSAIRAARTPGPSCSAP